MFIQFSLHFQIIYNCIFVASFLNKLTLLAISKLEMLLYMYAIDRNSKFNS